MKNITNYLIIIILFFQNCDENKEEIKKDPIIITSFVTDVSHYGGNDGSIDLTVTGGTPPYTFIWSDEQCTEDIDCLTAGIYIVTITDLNSINKSDTFILTQPAPDSLVLTITGQDVTFFGGNDGAAYSYVSGGIKPYIYSWSNGSSEKDITGLISGMYILTITDAEGTIVKDSIYISQPSENKIVITYFATDPVETGSDDGAIDITISGGYPPYNYLWSNGSVIEDQVNLSAGEYFVTVSDQKSQTTVKTIILTDIVTDIEGNIYSKIKIGQQLWMKENLRVKFNPDGESIVSYAYNNDTNYVATYGRLYAWDVAMDNSTLEGSQGICPCGWHIPSDAEFKTLEIYLGMTSSEADLENIWRGTGVGTSLKKGGSSGYDAMLSGRLNSYGQYSLLGAYEYMWTSTEYGSNAWRRCLDVNSSQVGRWNTFPKTYGFSVRCIKD